MLFTHFLHNGGDNKYFQYSNVRKSKTNSLVALVALSAMIVFLQILCLGITTFFVNTTKIN